MQPYSTLIIALVALLAGLATGKAWERYKLVEGRWIDRRRTRQAPHFILGLNFLVANQVDAAIEELEKAAAIDPGALEVKLVLGNLYREKGQVGRAVQEHQALLQRPRLNRIEHANVLLCLGLDYRRGGFIDRATTAFSEVLKLDPDNEGALANLEKLQEEQHQWQEAVLTRQRLAALAGPPDHPRSQAILAFLEHEIGLQALKQGQIDEAARRFTAAIELDRAVTPAYLHLGDVRLQQDDAAGAVKVWETMIDVAPERAYLAFARLERVYASMPQPAKFEQLCQRLIHGTPRDWRARVALAAHLTSRGEAMQALELVFEALEHNPHALAIHQAIWNTLEALDLPKAQVARYVEITRASVFYLDPHLCIRCRYRSTELLWQCPHCHEWNTFVEERITPATDNESELPAS
ncbi:MAG: tetratricopeptide repeat protein [Acidobacteria bacterium]|nr:tetratricopeptide repeat protein [Acidobacteriota bacterium]MBP8272949.1 tetratricopeptide repeat protein [Acidobacteriota bacterium]